MLAQLFLLQIEEEVLLQLQLNIDVLVLLSLIHFVLTLFPHSLHNTGWVYLLQRLVRLENVFGGIGLCFYIGFEVVLDYKRTLISY